MFTTRTRVVIGIWNDSWHTQKKQTNTHRRNGGVFKFGKYATPKVAASSWNISSQPQTCKFLFISDFTFNSKILWWSNLYPFTFLYVLFFCHRKLQRRWYTVLFFNSEWDNSLEFLGYSSYPPLFCCWLLLLRVVTVTDCRQQLRYIPYTYVFLSRIHMRPSFFIFFKLSRRTSLYGLIKCSYICLIGSLGPLFFWLGWWV